jgi:two-component system, OmpR family, phosphate regulon response regulator PhoB
MPAKTLVVDDERDLVRLVAYNLRQAGYDPITAYDGAAAMRRIREDRPDLVVLDVMLPDISGLEVCQQIRNDAECKETPVLLLTARGEEPDRVAGLESGADDYVPKPFSPKELVLRVQAIMRRTRRTESSAPVLKYETLEVDVERHKVKVAGREVSLTALEMRLLVDLMERRGRVQSREALLDRVWGYSSFVTTRTVDTHVKRLREKLAEAGAFVETVRGAGYRFTEGEEA